MANNQYVNKVVYGDQTLIDLSSDTIAANKIIEGYTAHSKDGASITGTIPNRNESNIQLTWFNNMPALSVTNGYYYTNFTHVIFPFYVSPPTSGTRTVMVALPNGKLNPDPQVADDWIPITFTVDVEGNSEITDGTQGPAEVVYF